MPRALITGISGQDGSYLAELLVGKGYDVHGTVRNGLLNSPGMLPTFLRSLENSVTLHVGQLEEPENLAALLRCLECDEAWKPDQVAEEVARRPDPTSQLAPMREEAG